MATQTTGQANLYELKHGSLHIRYSLTDLVGANAHFSYTNHGKQPQEFGPQQIQRVETLIGTLVSVELIASVDSDTTWFTLLIPNVNLQGETSCPIKTFGVTTVRHTTIAGPRRGQLDEYTVSHELAGTASFVMT